MGIGCLGAIATVTLQAVPIFTIERLDAPRPLAETLGLDEPVDGADHFELFTFSLLDIALTRTSTRDPSARVEPAAAWVRETLIENRIADLACRIRGVSPPPFPRSTAASRGGQQLAKIDRSHNVYATRRDVRFTEIEYAIPREHGAEAVRACSI